MHDGAGCCLNFRGCLAHRDPGDAFDLLPQQVGGVLEELSVKLLHLSGPLGGAGQGLLRGRQRLVQRDDQRVLAEDHGHGFGWVAGPPLLEGD